MKYPKNINATTFSFLLFTIFTILFISNPAVAGGLTVGVNMMQTVIGWLTGLAVGVATIAFMFIGYRMMFAAAQWKDVAPIFWGAIIIGAAGAIANVVTS